MGQRYPERTCSACGATFTDATPVGPCPACALAVGLTDAADDGCIDRQRLADLFPEYAIEGLLGRGGMGVVWRARDRRLDRDVALKVLTSEALASPGFDERFRREARSLAKLSHPNIVGVYDHGEREGTFFLVMELVDGVDLRHAMRSGLVGPRDALRIIPQVCDALQYAHESGIVHRDIKPENILVAKDGSIKVADFGLAKLVRGAVPPTLTVSGQALGTPAYMAPEQIETPTNVDHRADIYSLGVVFYELLTGELPLGRFDPPSRSVRIDVRIDDVVLRSLAKAPARRYQHASDVKREVGAITAGGGSPRLSTPGVPDSPPDNPDAGSIALVIAIVSIASGLILALSHEQGSGESTHPAVPLLIAAGTWAITAAVLSRSPRDGRLSAAPPRVALVGALGVPIALLATLAAFALSGAWGDVPSAPESLVPGAVAVVLGIWGMSALAWRRLGASPSRPRSRRLAVFGTLLPPALAIVWFAVWLAGGRVRGGVDDRSERSRPAEAAPVITGPGRAPARGSSEKR